MGKDKNCLPLGTCVKKVSEDFKVLLEIQKPQNLAHSFFPPPCSATVQEHSQER